MWSPTVGRSRATATVSAVASAASRRGEPGRETSHAASATTRPCRSAPGSPRHHSWWASSARANAVANQANGRSSIGTYSAVAGLTASTTVAASSTSKLYGVPAGTTYESPARTSCALSSPMLTRSAPSAT